MQSGRLVSAIAHDADEMGVEIIVEAVDLIADAAAQLLVKQDRVPGEQARA